MKKKLLFVAISALLLTACSTNEASSTATTSEPPADDRIPVSTIKDLQDLSFSKGKYKLVNDISLEEITSWSPIEDFKGTLDGENFKITNFNFEFSALENGGLFGNLQGSVKDLSISGDVVGKGGCENIGLLCGSNNGTISNIKSSGSVTAELSSNIGGIAGYSIDTIEGCENAASINGLKNIGGIVGSLLLRHNKSLLGASTNKGSVTGGTCIGGLFGKVYGDKYGYHGYDIEVKISKCSNEGAIASTENYVGGIAGYVSAGQFGDDISIYNSTNKGVITGVNYAGGIVGGSTEDLYKIDFCENTADVTSTGDYVGGYVGGSEGTYIYNAVNNNHITGNSYVGGIAGKANGLSSCENKGTVTGTGFIMKGSDLFARFGGVVGSAKVINKCVNSGALDIKSSGANIGGIAGELKISAATYGEIITGYDYPVMEDNKNSADISCKGSNIGGIVGYISMAQPNLAKSYTIEFKRNENTGKITSTSNYVGGIVGMSSSSKLYSLYGGELKFNTNSNTAAIEGHNYVGGILGFGNYVVEETTMWQTNTQSGEVVGDDHVGNYYGTINA